MYHVSQVSFVRGFDILDPLGLGRSNGPCPCLAASTRASTSRDSLAVSTICSIPR